MVAAPLRTARADLEPLPVDHAEEAMRFLDDVALHTYIGGEPAARAELDDRFARHVVGHYADGSQGWLNWAVREGSTNQLIGTVQATLTSTSRGTMAADVAWVVAASHQGRGFAAEAATAMVDWLRLEGVERITAHIHPEHAASAGVARRLDLHDTGRLIDGEVLWTDSPTR